MAQFKPGQSGNSSGRPRGSRNLATRLVKALENELPELLEKTVQSALAGDMTAMKLLLERTLPPQKSVTAPVKIPGLKDASGVAEKAEAVIDAISRGVVPPDVGCQLISALGSLGALRELHEVEGRLVALEEQLARTKS